jgi:hypothetical protein
VSANIGDRHPFLDDLTSDVVVTSTLMRRPVSGREKVTRLVDAVGSLYVSQTVLFHGHCDNRSLLQYEAELGNGKTIQGVVVVDRNADGSVPRVSVTFSPIDSVLSLATRLGLLLERDLGKDIFL